ncbi:TraX family protein [Nodosilinea sp. LEGE 07088]|nr:TraX family protein [Nodosilinea sp. LEGE 07088]
MLVDHIGAVFFPGAMGFRIIGRMSFPLFVWLLVQGEAHTRDVWRYGLRLAVLGVVSQPFYQLTFGIAQLNILFQLLLGLVCLRLARNFSRLQVPIWLCGGLLSHLLDLSYGSYGVGLIVLIRYIHRSLPLGLAWGGFHLIWTRLAGLFQLPAIAVPLLFWLTNGQRGPQARWFYGFYPGHLALLWLAQHLIVP